MAVESVASKINTEARRRVRSRSNREFMGSLTSLANQPGSWVVESTAFISIASGGQTRLAGGPQRPAPEIPAAPASEPSHSNRRSLAERVANRRQAPAYEKLRAYEKIEEQQTSGVAARAPQNLHPTPALPGSRSPYPVAARI